VFRYPRRGFGQLTEALADAAVGAGADIRLDTQAAGLVTSADGATVRTSDGAEITAAHVFSTVPLPVLARITTPAPAPGAAEGADHLRFRSIVLIYVVHDGPRPWTPFDAHYLPQAATPLTRVSEPANYRDSAADPRDRTVLCCELPCSVGDEHWTATDEHLGALVAEHLARVGLPPLRIAEVHTRRLPRVYPVYEIGFQRHLQALDDWAASLRRVTTFGRLGLFAHDNTHHALAMAYDAVDALGGGTTFDEAAWRAARRRFAAHVVED
jgi:protoporphyrinogen oxidase